MLIFFASLALAWTTMPMESTALTSEEAAGSPVLESLRLEGPMVPGMDLELVLEGEPSELFLIHLGWIVSQGELEREAAGVTWLETLDPSGRTRRVIPLPSRGLRGPGKLRAQAFGFGGVRLQVDRGIDPVVLESPEPKTGAQFGFAVRRADFNNDGSIDIAVGAKGHTENGQFSRGKAWVFWGPELDAWTTLSPPGLNDPAWYGASLTSIDIDNDGFEDLVVGAPRADHQGTFIDSGTAFVYFGPNLTSSIELPHPNPEPGAFYGGPLGSGDFNNDGFGDLAIPAPFASAGAVPAAGDVTLFYGPDLLTRSTVHSSVPTTGDVFGSCIDVGGVNSDGFDDLVIGASSATVAGVSDAGNAVVVFGPSFTNRALLTNPSPQPVGRYGRDCAIGDYNGDSFPDVAVSAYRAGVGPFAEAGEVFVFPGPSLSGPARIIQPIPEERAEYGVAVDAGDLDGDGTDELCVGSEFASIPGPVLNAGLVFVYQNALSASRTTTTLFDLPPEDGAVFGFSIDMANRRAGNWGIGNRFSIVVGAINADAGGFENAGHVLIFR